MSNETSQLFESISQRFLEGGDFTTSLIENGIDATGDEVGTKLNNPFSFRFEDFVPNEKILDLNRFFVIAGELIEDAQNREGVLAEQQVLLVEDFPNEDMRILGDEVISYRIIKREPGRMTADGTGRPQRAAMFYYRIQHPSFPNKGIEVSTQPIDHKIEFTCWARTAHMANKRALWLERLLVTHAWAFEVQGAERFHWIERNSDIFWSPHAQRLHQRPLVFFLRLREFEIRAHPLLKEIALEVLTGV